MDAGEDCWTLAASPRSGNHGKILRHTQAVRWLESCLTHMPMSGPDERAMMEQAITGEHELSENDQSPTYGVRLDAQSVMIQNYGAAHRHLTALLGLMSTLIDLVYSCGRAFTTPEPAPRDEFLACQ
eukprot:s526_g9.t1